MTIVDAPRPVTGGVDTHLDLNVAAALDPVGGLLEVAEFPATYGGHRRLLGWRAGFRAGGPGRRGGHWLLRCGPGPLPAGGGVEVVEVDRPNWQARRRAGKSGPPDAIEAAHRRVTEPERNQMIKFVAIGSGSTGGARRSGTVGLSGAGRAGGVPARGIGPGAGADRRIGGPAAQHVAKLLPPAVG